MSRKTLVRGIQLIVLITLATFSYKIYQAVVTDRESLVAGLATLRPGWLVVAAALALQEGVCGGLRIFVLGRVVHPKLAIRTAIVSEFVLMFCAGASPGQVAGPPAQVAVLVHSGMRLVDVATTELVVGASTILFFLLTALTIFVMRAHGMFHPEGGVEIDYLVWMAVISFGSALLVMIICAAYPPLLKSMIRAVAPPLGAVWRLLVRALGRIGRLRAWSERQRRGAISARLLTGVDDMHHGFGVYRRQGKLACLVGFVLTAGFFCSRFGAAYFILMGLGVDTTPAVFVASGHPFFQVVLLQGLLNFALYLAPSPGASGIAEAMSSKLMKPWIRGAYELPYLFLWRTITLFLCMFVGGLFVFRYLGTDLLEKQAKKGDAPPAAKEDDAPAVAPRPELLEDPPAET